MSWPHYKIGVASIDGNLVRLGPISTEILSTLLLAHPVRGRTYAELCEIVYKCETEPDYALNCLSSLIGNLRKRGIGIVSRGYGLGCCIPIEARA